MTLQQIQLVQTSYLQIVPVADIAADLFYARLFELDPALRRLFPTDLREQKKKLMTMLALAVNGLSRLDQLLPALQDLGRRHAAYGVLPAHYNTVAAALLWTIEAGLGAGFTRDVCEAWVSAYMLISSTMLNAADSVRALTSGKRLEEYPPVHTDHRRFE